MSKFDVDVVISKEPPTLWVATTIGNHQVPMARNGGGDWEGTLHNVDIVLPVDIEVTGSSTAVNRPISIEIKLTPSGGGAAIDYKKDDHLNGNGDYNLKDSIKAPAPAAGPAAATVAAAIEKKDRG